MLSLSDERAKAEETKKKYHLGIIMASSRTFEKIANEWLENKVRPIRTPTHVETIEQRLRRHVLPYIGKYRGDELKPQLVLSVLRRIEEQGKYETCYRVKNIISQVLRYGVTTGEVDRDFLLT